MNKPKEINTPIDTKRFKQWTDKFGSYRTAVNRNMVEEWLGQFKTKDRDLAARLLDSVMFFELTSIASNFRAVLGSMDRWNLQPTKRKGRWFFVAMSGSAGESGDLMLREFRRANGMISANYSNLFISRSDLVRKQLTNEDTVVLVDDFSGTGNQVCEVWNSPEVAFSELTAGAGNIYLVVIAATNEAKRRVANETPLHLVPAHILTEKDDLFSEKCKYFSDAEKNTVLEYSKIADKKNPKGFGDCGLLVVFNHGCPNNSLPILHVDNTKWTGLFPRHA